MTHSRADDRRLQDTLFPGEGWNLEMDLSRVYRFKDEMEINKLVPSNHNNTKTVAMSCAERNGT